MGTQTVSYRTPDASCGSCRNAIENAFTDVDGVIAATLKLDPSETSVTFDPSVIDEHVIVRILTEAGYAPVQDH